MDVGWSRLSDLNVHEGKLLGCSYNQSCVGVWVVDISVLLRLSSFLPMNVSFLVFQCWLCWIFILNWFVACNFLTLAQRIEPYAISNVTRLNGHSESKSSSSGNLSVLNENTAKASLGRPAVSQNSDPLVKETKSLGRLSVSQNSDLIKEPKLLACM